MRLESDTSLVRFLGGKHWNVDKYGRFTFNLSSHPPTPPPADVPVVTFDYVKKLVDEDKGVIIDVREVDELRQEGKIPTTVNIPGGLFGAFAVFKDDATMLRRSATVRATDHCAVLKGI